MVKIAHIDTETTGRKYWRHSIHQVGIILEIDGQVVAQKQWDCAPYIGADIEPKALEMSGKTMIELMNSPQAPLVHFEVKEMLRAYSNLGDPHDKWMISGFRCDAFDVPFLEAWWAQCGDNTFWDCFWKGSLDVMILAAQAFRFERDSFSSFSLEQLAIRLNILVDQERIHSALYDAELSREIYQTLTNGRITS